jgi:hypothetical protein
VVGITQALSPNDIVQSNLTYYTGHGYYSDPYKPLDTRPTTRETWAWLTRYNHYFVDADATLKLGYRLLLDSFGSTSNMFEAAWAQALPWGFTVTPGLRFYTQTSADFYMNPPFPRGFVEGQDYSADTRLASFGAITAGHDRGQVAVGRLVRLAARRLLPPGPRLADLRHRQPRHPDVLGALAAAQHHQELLAGPDTT